MRTLPASLAARIAATLAATATGAPLRDAATGLVDATAHPAYFPAEPTLRYLRALTGHYDGQPRSPATGRYVPATVRAAAERYSAADLAWFAAGARRGTGAVAG